VPLQQRQTETLEKPLNRGKRYIVVLIDWHNHMWINRPYFHWFYIELDPEMLPGEQTLPN